MAESDGHHNKKRLIGQPQKWRLIHNLSSHRLGRQRSINAGIKKENFPVTYPSINTAAHVLFCAAPRGCVVWGRDLKAYYRHLMINPAYWWCTGTMLDEKFYFDCYCPFGARSMPSVFQRLSDAIRVVMLRRTSVDALLGMLDDFLGVVYREPDLNGRGIAAAGETSCYSFRSGVDQDGHRQTREEGLAPGVDDNLAWVRAEYTPPDTWGPGGEAPSPATYVSQCLHERVSVA